jgi:hypothetical protein
VAAVNEGSLVSAPKIGLAFQPDGKFGHSADAAVRGFASGATWGAATEELKLLLVVGGVGHELAKM